MPNYDIKTNYNKVTVKCAGKKMENDLSVEFQGQSSGGSGSSISGGYSVTFMIDSSQYAIYSVIAGQSIDAPNKPSKTDMSFAGWYTSATNGTRITFPYTPTEDITLYAVFESTIIVGVTGLDNSTGVLTYTDSIANVDDYTTSTDGNYVNVTSPLSDYFPFSEIEEFTDSEGNVFVKFPKLWMKWETDSDGVITGYKFSDKQADSNYFIPDAFLGKSEDKYLDYFALGKYEMSGSSSKGYSKSGQTCYVNCTRANARAAARAYGTLDDLYNGYQQLDFAQFTLYNLLCMMYYKTANIQTVYGGRTSYNTNHSWSSASQTGTCDGLEGMNGWNTSTDCVKMLGIENPYGNIYKWVDGVYFSGSTIYSHRYPWLYADDSSNATNLGFSRPTTSGVFISKLKHGTIASTQSYAYASGTDGSASTYYGDKYWYSSSGTVLYVGGDWSGGSSAGLWCLNGYNSASGSGSIVGARLSYRPL